MKAIDKHTVRFIFDSLFLFSQLPWIGQSVPYFGVSVGCLEGVWRVSWTPGLGLEYINAISFGKKSHRYLY